MRQVLFRCLGQNQVFDLNDSRPGPVLKKLYENILEGEKAGNPYASHMRK